jgi:hypothetical protein
MVLTTVLGVAIVAGLLAGMVGAVAGGVTGLLVGVIDRQLRGLTRSEVGLAAAALRPGGWATVVGVRPGAETLVQEELARLGAARPARFEPAPVQAVAAPPPVEPPA